jgi:hypothetical protein
MVVCQIVTCNRTAIYGYFNDKIKLRCSIHRILEPHKMINLNCRLCECGTRPTFGFLNDKQATCCFKCKKDNMINITDKKCPC